MVSARTNYKKCIGNVNLNMINYKLLNLEVLNIKRSVNVVNYYRGITMVTTLGKLLNV